MEKEVFWTGPAPQACDLCKRKLTFHFIDGKTSLGPWAIMCPACRTLVGPTDLGPGRGQKYQRRGFGDETKWVKVGG